MKRFFLYIDLLGFTELVNESSAKVDDLYNVIASLHAHSHNAFKAIVFSDTVLIYNCDEPKNHHDKQYLIMYLCEFAQDLQQRLAGCNLFFRAIITYGEFTHYTIKTIPCFYGQALIDTYTSEKNIKAMGLFIDSVCKEFNEIFETTPYNEKYNFVYLTQSLEKLEYTYGGNPPFPNIIIEETDLIWSLVPELITLRNIYENIKRYEGDIKLKYINTWELYLKKYPKILNELIKNKFDFNVISPESNWDRVIERFPEDYSWIRK